ncbi:MAG TPA: hypothetical protein VK420_13450 [Longimicrobium sp.]|nr:hypothetical protein [Longimicrobium sp.]
MAPMHVDVPRRGTVGLFGLLCCAVFLSGCQPELLVALASEGEQLPSPGFVVTDPERPTERPRYTSIQVLQQDGKTVWRARAEPFGDLNSVARFSYGQPPSGFVSVEGPEPLQAGRRYTVAVSGHKRGGMRFDVDAGGAVRVVRE